MEERKEVKGQKKYKDTIFRMLYKDRERALSLYNSVNGTTYDNPEMLEFNTLDNAIYMNVKNDLSFLIANQVNLYEHQSTLPVNMPLRDLFYVADILQKMYRNRTIYDSRMIQIPNPDFVVFYNGASKLPERMELKLSDSFLNPTDQPSLELKVTVLNVNSGMNEQIKEKCPSLKEYITYVEKVRNYAETMELTEAVNRAVNECIAENVLKDFLLDQKAEVVKLSIYEYDEERELQLIREGEREIGREEGKDKLNKLYQRLKSDNRVADLMKAIDDKEYQNRLMEEYGISEISLEK